MLKVTALLIRKFDIMRPRVHPNEFLYVICVEAQCVYIQVASLMDLQARSWGQFCVDEMENDDVLVLP